jgi:hypothetical protein
MRGVFRAIDIAKCMNKKYLRLRCVSQNTILGQFPAIPVQFRLFCALLAGRSVTGRN